MRIVKPNLESRGQPPINTSPRPSATGNLQSVILDGSDTGVGLELETTFSPLFQTNLLPDLMQVQVLPLAIEVDPTVLQVVPALTAALAVKPIEVDKNEINTRQVTNRFMQLTLLNRIESVSITL